MWVRASEPVDRATPKTALPPRTVATGHLAEEAAAAARTATSDSRPIHTSLLAAAVATVVDVVAEDVVVGVVVGVMKHKCSATDVVLLTMANVAMYPLRTSPPSPAGALFVERPGLHQHHKQQQRGRTHRRHHSSPEATPHQQQQQQQQRRRRRQ